MAPSVRSILDYSLEELASWMEDQGQPALRARQVHRWLFSGRAASYDQMTDLPLALRKQLSEEIPLFRAQVDRHLQSTDGTGKLLTRFPGDHLIECVLLHEDDRHTACISTQVGCGMGCVFCASGLYGVERNLTTGEILEQLILLRNLLPEDQRLTHVVVMGMGEPLANLDALMEALSVATTPLEGSGKGKAQRFGLGMSSRHITISTVGLPAKIRQLADRKQQYHLAVSLHAPNNRIRAEIVPMNEKVGLEEILEAADYFYDQTKRQVTYEYVMLRDLNDQPEHAEELARLLQGRQAHINLIPFNDVKGLPYRRPSSEAIADFVERLRRRGLVAHVRKRKGADIDAACGQLRRSALQKQEDDTPPLLQLGQESAGS